MSSIITLFDQQDVKLFFDKKTRKLILKKKDVHYNISLNSDNIGEESFKQKVDNLESIIRALRITGKIGPPGPEGLRGKQGIPGLKGEKGDKGDKGKSFEIAFYLDSELDLPHEVEDHTLALINRTLNLYVFKNKKWENIGNLRLLEGSKGDKGEKGEKGDNGSNLHIDYIFNSPDDLEINLDKEKGSIAIIKNSLDLHVKTTDGWENLGKLKSVKGDKGNKGDIGEKGERGEKG